MAERGTVAPVALGFQGSNNIAVSDDERKQIRLYVLRHRRILSNSGIKKLGNYHLNSLMLENKANKVLDKLQRVIYYISMMNVTKCDECGKAEGHEIWCNFYLGPKGQSARPVESEWTVETTFGTRRTFRLAPKATLETATNYALRYIDGALTHTLKRIA
jgi:hypothetical protein